MSNIANATFYIIDWAGNVMFNYKSFKSFEEAEEFLSIDSENNYESEREEYSIISDAL